MPDRLDCRLTADAKKVLAETIRGTSQDPEKGVRARLLRAIHDEADRRYRLSVSLEQAGLDEAQRRRRERIEAWIDERARATKPKNKAELETARQRLVAQAEKEAAATLVNRLVLLRQLEALGLSKPAVVTGGWSSKGYREFREFAPTLCTNGTTDASEGYARLLQLLFDELAVDLPGLFGDVGLTRLFPVPAATLREVIERLDDPGLESAWTDDTTLGWVYQYWNDPDREELDAKITAGRKIEPHEIASKTQMFTERYMVEWLLQNSLGLTWLAMCEKHGWTPDAARILPVLDERRAAWRMKRDAGEVELDALMPIEGELEEHWKYYVPQPIPDQAVEEAPESVRAIKILDPACGSGHFLVIAFDLLVALYREEARKLGTDISDREIAESILENNLYGIDIDARAIQIAAAGLYLKAKSLAKTARPKRLSLVAPVFQLGDLPKDDPAILALMEDLKVEVGIPEELTNRLLSALAGVDYLGSLLKVDAAVDEAIKDVELEFQRKHGQGDLFHGFPSQELKLSVAAVKASILDKLEQFLFKHSKSEDIGLRLDGEQLAAGVRFIRMTKEAAYELVVGNPPYLGLSKADALGYIARNYPRAKADLYAAFLERGLEFIRAGGRMAMITMRGWMFISQFVALRTHILQHYDIHVLGDVNKGAFSSRVLDDLLAACMFVISRARPRHGTSIALQASPPTDWSRDTGRTPRKRAALLAHVGQYEFEPRGFKVIKGEPIVYWWSKSLLNAYASTPKLEEIAVVRQGLCTGDNTRTLRKHWELAPGRAVTTRVTQQMVVDERHCDAWVPFIKGGEGRLWIEPLEDVVDWRSRGLGLRLATNEHGKPSARPQNTAWYFRGGVAFTTIGNTFGARQHRFRSIFGDMGRTVFHEQPASIVASMNTAWSREVLSGLAPGIHFAVGDVLRLPYRAISQFEKIDRVLDEAFTQHEHQREASAEFRQPGGSPWRHAQEWAQRAIDRLEGTPLPPYEPSYDPPTAELIISFSIGAAIGRFDTSARGILSESSATALSNGIMFLAVQGTDGLDDPACDIVRRVWEEQRRTIGEGQDLRGYLRKVFFERHRQLYDNRPIYFPLSSAKKSFMAFVLIHRWAEDTLNILLADQIMPTKRRLEGELDDLRTAKASGSNGRAAEKRFTEVQKLLEELNDFIMKITDVAEKGPPPSDDKTMKREVDARYVMDLDDGVMVNSAALWPLLEPQWKDPKKWWKELANAQGKKDYDWSHLAARYFPARVRKKCHEDPSLAVAHECFWELHPAKAYAWELRLQDEIRQDFTIDEPSSDVARATFLKEHDREAREIVAKELKRREKKNAKGDEEAELPFTQEPGDEDADD